MLREDGHDNPAAWLHSAERRLCGVDVNGRDVLEVGSGRGLMALYLALSGARVVSMEPEMVGSRSGMIEVQRSRAAQLHLPDFSVLAADFNTWEAAGLRFDVIVSCSAINHLYPSSENALRHAATYDGYLKVAARMRAVLGKGGTALVSDACRYGFFPFLNGLGVRRPWRWKRSNVNWRVHQQPATWRRVFRDAGFGKVEVHYPVPHRLRMVGPVAGTAVANFFLEAGFCLRADA